MCADRNQQVEAVAAAKNHFVAALTCHGQGAFVQAEILYRKALELAPGRPSVMFNLSAVLFQQRKYGEAHELCAAVVDADPQNAAALTLLGNCLAQQNKADIALQAYDRALQLKPDFVDGLNNRGTLHFKRGNYLAALSDYDSALGVDPDHVEACYNRGRALRELQRPEEALVCYERALAAKVVFPDLHHDFGNALLDLGRLDEAAEHYHQALHLNPVSAENWNALGVIRQEQGDIDEALAAYDKALSLDPYFRDAHYNRARALLYCRNFGQAWPEYEYRISATGFGSTLRHDPRSMALFEGLVRWSPGHQPTGAVAIWGEQGIGDQLLFSTLIPDLLATGTPFIYEVDRRLLAAYQRAFPQTQFVPLQEPPAMELQKTAAVLLAGSLPGLLRQSSASFSRQPRKLLSALPTRVEHYQKRLAELGQGLKVALSWRSTRVDRLGREKSVSLEQFSRLFDIAGVQFVDVQYGDTKVEREKLARIHGSRLLHFEEVNYHRDLEEVFAILESCDLLITTSNANAHFAGALGKSTWLLYPAGRMPFHYWAQDKDRRCLWYPSVEIISASELTDWTSLISFVEEKLRRDFGLSNSGISA